MWLLPTLDLPTRLFLSHFASLASSPLHLPLFPSSAAAPLIRRGCVGFIRVKRSAVCLAGVCHPVALVKSPENNQGVYGPRSRTSEITRSSDCVSFFIARQKCLVVTLRPREKERKRERETKIRVLAFRIFTASFIAVERELKSVRFLVSDCTIVREKLSPIFESPKIEWKMEFLLQVRKRVSLKRMTNDSNINVQCNNNN